MQHCCPHAHMQHCCPHAHMQHSSKASQCAPAVCACLLSRSALGVSARASIRHMHAHDHLVMQLCMTPASLLERHSCAPAWPHGCQTARIATWMCALPHGYHACMSARPHAWPQCCTIGCIAA
eukprot:365863-Chlamydomonas_euryale.AAC.3